MFAKTLFARAASAAKFNSREEALMFIEIPLDTLAKVNSFQMLGIDVEDALPVVREIRDNFDKAIHFYQRYGRTYLPNLPTSMSPMLSWILVFMYLAMTRGGAKYMTLPHLIRNVCANPKFTAPVSRMILEFTHNHKLWENAEDYFEKILITAGMQYQPLHKFLDGDDVLMVANLVGLHKAHQRSVTCIEQMGIQATHHEEEAMAESFPPIVTALMSPEMANQMRKAYFLNVNSFELVRMDYMSVQCPEEKKIEIIRAVLIAHGLVEPANKDPEVWDTIREAMVFLNRYRTEPIPQSRDKALFDRVKKHLGFSLARNENDDLHLVVYNICAIMSVTLEEHSPSMH